MVLVVIVLLFLFSLCFVVFRLAFEASSADDLSNMSLETAIIGRNRCKDNQNL